LREKHNIIAHANPMDCEGELYYIYEIVIIAFEEKKLKYEVISKVNDAFDYSEQQIEGNYLNNEKFKEHLVLYSGGKAYEEALEKGLFEALKLIKL
jgi:hypothetical protein